MIELKRWKTSDDRRNRRVVLVDKREIPCVQMEFENGALVIQITSVPDTYRLTLGDQEVEQLQDILNQRTIALFRALRR